MRKEKIFIVCYNNLNQTLVGGLRAYELFKYLKNKGYDVSLITRERSEGYELEIKEIKLPIILSKIIQLFFTDNTLLWSIKVYNYLKKVENNSVIYVTAPPHGLLILPILLSKIKKIKTISDFRDPFTLNDNYNPRILFKKKIDSFLEKKAINKTDRLIFNTTGHRRAFCNKYTFLNEEKYSVINNGYMYENFSKQRKKGLVYFGGHYKGEMVRGLKLFLVSLNAKSDIPLKCDVYGEYHNDFDRYDNLFNYKGKVSRKELKTLLADYKIGLMYYTKTLSKGGSVPTKFYEIIGLGLYPFFINPTTDVMEKINRLGYGSYVYEEDIDNVDKSILARFDNIKYTKNQIANIRINSREYQNSLFLNILEKI